MTPKPNEAISYLTEKQISRMRNIFDKVMKDKVSMEEVIDKALDPTMEDLFPSLMSKNETREAITTLMGLMPRFAGKEFFIKIRGFEEPKIFKTKMELLPRPLNISKASEEEVEGIPGIEFNAKIIPILLKGKINELYQAIAKRDTVKIHGLPSFAEWFGGSLDVSNFIPLILLFNKNVIDSIRKQLVPVLDKTYQNLDLNSG